MSTKTVFGGDVASEFPVGTTLSRDGREAEVINVRVGNATYGVLMATVRWADNQTLLSLPFSTVRREFTRQEQE